MTLSLAIVVLFLLLALGLVILVSAPKARKTTLGSTGETLTPLLFTTPLLSWLVYVKYNEVEASLFVAVPVSVIVVMVAAIGLLFFNFKK